MVHIRQSASMATFCGQLGGSISLEHYQQNPSDHVSTLAVCPACVSLAGFIKDVAAAALPLLKPTTIIGRF